MTRILALLLAALPTLATADTITTGNAAADDVIAKALAEHEVFITCSSLSKTNHDQIVKNWQSDAIESASILSQNKVPPEAIAAFVAAAKVEALLPAPGTPYSEVKTLCDAQPNWEDAYWTFNMTFLALKLPGAFAQ